jgi:hypothetical protein
LKHLNVEVKELISEIDEQLDDHEKQRKADKLEAIKSLDDYAPYSQIDPRWLNKSFGISKIEDELERQKEMFANNSTLINTTCKSLKLKPDKYIQMLMDNVPAQEIVEQINNDHQVLLENQSKAKEVEHEADESPVSEDDTDPITYHYKYEIDMTRAQRKALEQFMEDKNIGYEEVENELEDIF